MDHDLMAELNRISNALENLEVLLRDIQTRTADQGVILERLANASEKAE